MIVAIYIDDIILTGDDISAIEALKAHLHQVSSIKDLRDLHYFLDMEISLVQQGIIMTHKKFTKELLASSSFDLSKQAKNPLSAHVKLTSNSGEYYYDPARYRSLVGKLNFSHSH